MQDIYLTFEFEKIRQSISEYSHSELGKEYISSLATLKRNDLINEKEFMKEISSIVTRFGPFPIKNSANILKLINIAKKTYLLTPRDLYLIREDILLMGDIVKFYEKLGLDYPFIKSLIDKFNALDNLEKEIKRTITSSLTVDDKASENLSSIRRRIKKLENNLQEKITTISLSYKSLMGDDNVTLRDGHFVLPIKTAFKNKVVGIIYDVSDSGNTTFIEPIEIVQLNNEITSLKLEENEEIRKILKVLTSLVLLQEEEILENNKIIARIDFLQSKALYGNEINGQLLELKKERTIVLKNAKHPLIDKDKVIANTYCLDEEKRILIISGPNAGGKTVSLKTVGLLVLMNQCGLMIPVSSGSLSYFDNIYIDIGDNQSLSDNLSTFSAHISNIANIVNIVKGNDLVLVDELGTGTDPLEGEAIAISVIKYLKNKNCFALISSHFSRLKEYAFLNSNIENSSMIFNEEKLVPTYIFKQGVPGKSYALDVAKRYGLKDEIISDAKEYISKDKSEANNLLEILQNKLDENVKLEIELKRKEEQLNKEAKRLEVDSLNLNNKREKLLVDVKEEKEKIINSALKEVDNIIKTLSNPNIKANDAIEVKRKLDDLKENEEMEEFNETINVGDYVSVPSLNIFGYVKAFKGKKAILTTDSNMTVEASISNLKKLEKKVHDTKKKVMKDIIIEKSIPSEINLLGYRVNEAIETVDKYLDSCRVKRMHQVRIIHGFGSGALKKAIQSYLDKQKDLSYRSGNEYEGGGGTTIVIFND
ncbi:MAG: endonuclease MutS2 [Bacilli bacterium]